VLLDLVVNHTSDEHPWFVESRSSLSNPKRDWYLWKPAHEGREPTRWPSVFGGSVWERDELTGEYYFHTFSRKQPDLNWENPQVRQAVYDMMHWWIDRGIAGFRVDAITFIKKNPKWPDTLDAYPKNASVLDGGCCNFPGILDHLRELRDQVLVPRGMVTVAESPGVAPAELADYIGEGRGVFNMIFTFDHVDVDARFDQPYHYVPWTLSIWKSRMTQWQSDLGDNGWLGLYLENHDHVRSVSKFGAEGLWREPSAKTLATWYFLMRGTPFIYQGQELGMTNTPFEGIGEYRDVSSRNAFRDGLAAGKSEDHMLDYLAKRSRDHSRTPLPWDASAQAGFTRGVPWIKVHPDYRSVNVASAQARPDSVFHHYRRLIALRKSRPELVHGGFEELYAESDAVGAYRRHLGERTSVVLANFTAEAQRLPRAHRGDVLLASSGRFDGQTLAPWQSVVVAE